MASKAEKHTVAYRNVKKCEFHNIGAYIVAVSIIGGTTFCAFFDSGLHTEESLKGIVLDEKEQYGIKALSLIWEKDLKETCDRINRALQAFFDIWDTLKELFERILEVLPQREDICESCQDRRTRHGSSKAEKPRETVANIKWSEKFRPP